MGVDLFSVFLLETEDHLDWWEAHGVIFVWANELLLGCDRELGRVLELFQLAICRVRISVVWTDDVSDCFPPIHVLLHDSVLEDPNRC